MTTLAACRVGTTYALAADRRTLRRAAGSAPPADFVPTIEQVAEALGEPLAHVAPWCWRRAGTVPVWLWRLRTERGPVVGGEAYRATDYYVTGPTRADALRAAWADLSARPELEWDTTVPGEVNGEKVTRYVTKSVKPGSKDYPHAVRDTLQREFHYDIRVP